VFCLLLLLLLFLLVLCSFLASALLYGITFAFLCIRNPLWTPLGQTLRHFLSHSYRPAVFHRFDRGSRRSFHAEGPKANIFCFVLNLSIYSLIVFTSTPCLSSSSLPSSFIIYLLTPDEDNFLSKALMFHCSLCFVV